MDFETEAIEPRPNYPPKPVGVSIKYANRPAKYYAFGHPTGNNCTHKDACAAIADAWQHPGGLVFHNGKFDVDVAQTHMGMGEVDPLLMHDTMFLVFFDNPHAESHGLKQSAERLLGMAPEERDAVKDWLVNEGICTRTSKDWGAYISKAPGDLVGRYADGDVVRTEKLFNLLMPDITSRGMLVAYQREQRLMPCLLEMERHGVPIDLPRLEADCNDYALDLLALTQWCSQRLKTKRNLDSADELVAALIAAEKVDLSLLGKTPKGAWKTDKASLAAAVTDKVLSAALAHRASLHTCLGTFMQPWLDTAKQSGGRIFTQWNQLKQYYGRDTIGAVTGRLSSTPNFQNIPKEFKPLWAHQEEHLPKKERLGLPKCPLTLRPLPLVRSYIAASPGHVLICRDYSQQELRILAHYEDGDMAQSYRDDCWLDIHEKVQTVVNEKLNSSFERGVIKQINFGLIYGMGVDLMAQKAGCEPAEAKAAKAAVLSAYPGLKELQKGLKKQILTPEYCAEIATLQNDLTKVAEQGLVPDGKAMRPMLAHIGRLGGAIRTWGGRQYHCEPPALINGKLRTFEYKLLNVLVQGSAADCTKEAIIRYFEDRPENHHLLLTVHDELLGEVPEDEMDIGMRLMQTDMDSIEFDLEMLSEGKVSATNWSELRVYDKKGERK